MTVVGVLDLKLHPGKLDAAREVVHRVLEETRGFEGCVGVDVMVDGHDPAHLVVIERWASPEADAAYRAFRAGTGAITDLTAHLATAPVLTKGELDTTI